MPTMAQQAVTVKSGDIGAREGLLSIKSYTSQERTLRALKGVGLLWLIAVVCVFIPLLHFILVPGFLLGGLYVGYSRYQAARVLDNVESTCPVCEQSITLTLDPSDALPLWTYCPNCKAPLNVAE